MNNVHVSRVNKDSSQGFFLKLYHSMLRIRIFEEQVAEYIEKNEIKTPCHLCIGQEAIAVGICETLTDKDTIWGGHRSHGHYLAKGGNSNALMAEIFCKSTGCSNGRGGSMHLTAPEVGVLGTVPLVGATIPLAVGAGLASKLRNDGNVSVSFFGDGATEEGVFHESMNLAAFYKLPVIFVCENNFYASHLSLTERRLKDNIVDSAEAHGIPGVRLDGNDVHSVYLAAKEFVDRAKKGHGPSFLECRTYRWRGHVGPSWDMDVGVKRKNELKDWFPMDPIKRLREHIIGMGIERNELERIKQEAKAEVDAAVVYAKNSPYPDASDLNEHVFVTNSKVS